MQKKSTTLNSEGLKRGTKRLNMKNTQIFHFTQPFQAAFTCPNSLIKTEKHCAKNVQKETKNKYCKFKCVKLKFLQMCSFSIIFISLHSLEFYHFHGFPISFLLLYLSFNLDSVHHHPDFRIFCMSIQILRKQLLQLKNKHFPLLLLHNPRYQINHCLHHLRRHQ